MNQKNLNNSVITKKDLIGVFFRSFTIEWSWNYIKQQNLGYAYAMIPILNKVYKKKEDRIDAYQRHLEFFNITPWLSTIPLGITIAMEEARAKDTAHIDASAISNIKVALMGPISGIGDSMFWGTLRVIATGLSIGFAKQGNILGPILFLLAFNIPALLIRWFGLVYSFRLGEGFVDRMQENGFMQKLTFGATIVGLLVIGAMAGSLISLNVSYAIGEGETAQTLSQIADEVIPNFFPLLSVFGCFYLVKKNIRPQYIILLIAIVGIIGAYFGFLGVA